MDESFPALAHRVTVLGSTRKSAATSAGVRSASSFCAFILCLQCPRPRNRGLRSPLPASIPSPVDATFSGLHRNHRGRSARVEWLFRVIFGPFETRDE